MQHISGILAGVAYALLKVKNERKPVVEGEMVFLPDLSSDSFNRELTTIIGVIEKHTGSFDGWAQACARAYLEKPILEREEFREHLSEFFKIEDTPDTPKFSHLVLTSKGKELGKQVYLDRLIAMRRIASELLMTHSSAGLIHFSRK